MKSALLQTLGRGIVAAGLVLGLAGTASAQNRAADPAAAQRNAEEALRNLERQRGRLENSRTEIQNLQRNPPAPADARALQQQQRSRAAHEEAKAAARAAAQGGALNPNALVTQEKVDEVMHEKARAQVPAQGGNGQDTAVFELALAACEQAVFARRARGQALSDLCAPLTSPATASPGSAQTALFATRISMLCDEVDDQRLAPQTDFGNHCAAVSSSQRYAAGAAAARPVPILETQPSVNVQDHYNAAAADQNAVAMNYSGCPTADCGGMISSQTCVNGNCWDASYKADGDMATAATMVEVARQGGRYHEVSEQQLFRGYAAKCKEHFNLTSAIIGGNCCEENALLETVFSILNVAKYFELPDFEGGLGGGGATAPGESTPANAKDLVDENGIPLISDKTEDFMLLRQNAALTAAGLRTLTSLAAESDELWRTLKNMDFKKPSDYARLGFKIFISSPYEMAQDMSEELTSLVTELLTLGGFLVAHCTAEDAETKAMINRSLCVKVGSHCSANLVEGGFLGIDVSLGPCTADDHNYCCFNSVLSKIINTQGRAQLLERGNRAAADNMFVGPARMPVPGDEPGRIFGESRNFSCTGFTVEQMALVDFARMDFTEYTRTLAPNTAGLDRASIMNRIMASLGKCTSGTSQCEADAPRPTVTDDVRFVGIGGPPVDPGEAAAIEARRRASLAEPNMAPMSGGTARQYLSLKPLLDRAFAGGNARGSVNFEDVRLLSKWRYFGDNQPVIATIRKDTDHPRLPGCSFMRINLKQEPSTHTSETGDRTITYEGQESNSTITYCRDGRVM